MTQKNKKQGFESIKFPIVKNVSAKTLSDSIGGIIPDAKGPKIVEEYTNIWGELVKVTEGGLKITNSHKSNLIPGNFGHCFGKGYYIVNENGEMVFNDNKEEHTRLILKYRYLNELYKKVNKEFETLLITIGPNDSVAIDDREIVEDCFWGIPKDEKEVDEYFLKISNKIKKHLDND